MPRGGKRTGKQGGQYSNRSDLAMNAGTATHMPDSVTPYGSGTTASELPQGQGPESAVAPVRSAPAGPQPGSLTPLGSPTERPDESVLAGLNDPRSGVEDPDEQLRALYMMFPHEDIRELLEMRGLA